MTTNKQLGGEGLERLGGGEAMLVMVCFFWKIATRGRMTNHGYFATGSSILMGLQGCMPQTHDNQQAVWWGRAGTAGGRWGDVSYDVFFLKNCDREEDDKLWPFCNWETHLNRPATLHAMNT